MSCLREIDNQDAYDKLRPWHIDYSEPINLFVDKLDRWWHATEIGTIRGPFTSKEEVIKALRIYCEAL